MHHIHSFIQQIFFFLSGHCVSSTVLGAECRTVSRTHSLSPREVYGQQSVDQMGPTTGKNGFYPFMLLVKNQKSIS